jgi:hypothetical protein
MFKTIFLKKQIFEFLSEKIEKVLNLYFELNLRNRLILNND